MLTPNRTDPRTDLHLRSILQHIEAHRHELKAVSFDFFDTIVHRLSDKPHDLFLLLGARLKSRGRLNQDLLPAEYRQIRRTAEQLARQNATQVRRADVNLQEIHALMAQAENETSDVLEHEMDCEVEMCWPNPAVLGLIAYVQSLGLKTVITSDIYLPSRLLLAVLQSNGFPVSMIDLCLASNEHNAVKSDGSLFKIALQKLGISPNEIIHIGDNYAADIKGAQSVGITAFHYDHDDSYFTEVLGREKAMAPETDNHPVSFNWIRLLAQRTTQHNDSLRRYFDQGVFNLGPVMARYADYAVDRFVAAGVTQVLAPMREGELMGELLKRAAEAKKAPLKVHVFYMSRRATALPSVGAATVLDVHRVITNGLKVSNVGDAFRRLGFFEHAARLPAEAAKQLVSTPGVMQETLRTLCTGSFAQQIQATAAEKRALFMDYLESTIGESAPKKLGIFDLGWGGTIQSQLRKILKLANWDTKIVGCYLSTDQRGVEMYLAGDEVYSYIGGLGSNPDLNFVRWQPEILEAAISVGTGPAVDYERGPDGRGRPVLGPQPISDDENARRTKIRAGILEFQSRWLELKAVKPQFLANPVVCGRLDVQAVAILRRLVEFPTTNEAEIYGGLGHDHGMIGEDSRVDVIHAEDERSVKTDGAHMLFLHRNTMWRQGLIAKLSPGITEGLSRGWMGTRALGHMASWAWRGGEATGFSEDDLRLIEQAVLEVQPQNIVIVGGTAMGNARWAAGVRSLLSTSNSATITELSHTPLPRAPLRLDRHQRIAVTPEDAARTWMKLDLPGRTVVVIEPEVPDAQLSAVLQSFNEVTRKDDRVIATHGNAENFRRPDEIPRSRDIWVFSQLNATKPGLQRQQRDNLWTMTSPLSDRISVYLQTREQPLLREHGKALWRGPVPAGWVESLEKRGWTLYEITDALCDAVNPDRSTAIRQLLSSSQPAFLAAPSGSEGEPWKQVAQSLGIPTVEPHTAAVRLPELENFKQPSRPSSGPLWTLVQLGKAGPFARQNLDPSWYEIVSANLRGDFPVPQAQVLRVIPENTPSHPATLRDLVEGGVPPVPAPAPVPSISPEVRSRINAGERLFGEGDTIGAFREFSQALEGAPELAEAWNNLGVTLLAMGRNDDAADALDRAIQLDSSDLNALVNRARLGWLRGPTGRVAAALRAQLSPEQHTVLEELSIEGQGAPRALLIGLDRSSLAAQALSAIGWRTFGIDPTIWSLLRAQAPDDVTAATAYLRAVGSAVVALEPHQPNAETWRLAAKAEARPLLETGVRGANQPAHFHLPSAAAPEDLSDLQLWLGAQTAIGFDPAVPAPLAVLGSAGSDAALAALLDRVAVQDIDPGALEAIVLVAPGVTSPGARPFRVRTVEATVAGWQSALNAIGNRPWIGFGLHFPDDASRLQAAFSRP